MNCVWTNTINSIEICDSTPRQASIFLDSAWSAEVNNLYTTDPLVLAHIDNMLDLYGILTVVVLWYFNELSPDTIEGTLNVELSGVSCTSSNITSIKSNHSVIDNMFVQSWLTFEKSVPETPVSEFDLMIQLSGSGPTYSYAGAFCDVRLCTGEYTHFRIGDDLDPNDPAGLSLNTVLQSSINLNPLLSWGA